MNSSVNQFENKLISFQGNIHLITNHQELSVVVDQLNSAKVLGFDTETKPSFKKGDVFKVALLQLATEEDAYLIRLQRINQFEIIQNIFENPEILKVGVALRDDIKQLQKRFSFRPQGFVELQEIAKSNGLQNFGLQGMTEEVLKAKLSKGPKLTNWEASELTDQQLLYAATDAWIGLKLFQTLQKY